MGGCRRARARREVLGAACRPMQGPGLAAGAWRCRESRRDGQRAALPPSPPPPRRADAAALRGRGHAPAAAHGQQRAAAALDLYRALPRGSGSAAMLAAARRAAGEQHKREERQQDRGCQRGGAPAAALLHRRRRPGGGAGRVGRGAGSLLGTMDRRRRPAAAAGPCRPRSSTDSAARRGCSGLPGRRANRNPLNARVGWASGHQGQRARSHARGQAGSGRPGARRGWKQLGHACLAIRTGHGRPEHPAAPFPTPIAAHGPPAGCHGASRGASRCGGAWNPTGGWQTHLGRVPRRATVAIASSAVQPRSAGSREHTRT